MTYNEKKSLYESIMKDVAKTVKRQINEAGVVSFAPISDSKNISFRELYKLISNYFTSANIKERKGIYVESSNEDIQFAALNVILKALGERKVYRMSVAGFADSFRTFELDKLNNYQAIIISDFSYAQRSAIPTLLNLVDGRFNDKKILPKVIVMGTGSNDELDAAPIAQRFISLKLNY